MFGRPRIRKRRWQESDQRPGPSPVVVAVVVTIPSQSMREFDRNVQRRLRLRQGTVQYIAPLQYGTVVRVESEDATEATRDSFLFGAFVAPLDAAAIAAVVVPVAGEGQRSHSVMLQFDRFESARRVRRRRRFVHSEDGAFEMSSVGLVEPVEIIPRRAPAVGIVDIGTVVPGWRTPCDNHVAVAVATTASTAIDARTGAVRLQNFQSALVRHPLPQQPPHAPREGRHLLPTQISLYIIDQSHSFQGDIILQLQHQYLHSLQSYFVIGELEFREGCIVTQCPGEGVGSIVRYEIVG
mmetsp:Transcript_2224/g.3875  ORF Transcript_2224/g.3875 Transcript_2224/m.3875 type:complete len:296 (-) Transcript_2224:928-1815(-)